MFGSRRRGPRARSRWLALLGAGIVAAPFVARAQTVTPPTIPTVDPSDYIPDTAVVAMVRTLGYLGDQRPYEAATGLGTTMGLEASLEITMVKLTPDFNQALKDMGIGDGSSSVESLPIPRLQAHKGIGDSFDLGISALSLSKLTLPGGISAGLSVYGADAKWAFFVPSEGPTWALRLCYSQSKLSFEQSGVKLTVSSTTWTPQLLVSKPLDFAEPYAGIGYSWVSGKVRIDTPIPDNPFIPSYAEKGATGSAFGAFTGVGFRIPAISLKIAVGGAYSSAGASSLGTKLGFVF